MSSTWRTCRRPALARYPAFLAQARAALKPLGREVWVTAPFGDDDWPLRPFQAVSDTVVLMAYDQHWGAASRAPPPARTGSKRPWPTTCASSTRPHRRRPRGLWLRLDAGRRQGTGRRARRSPSTTPPRPPTTPTLRSRLDDNALNPTFAYDDDDGRKHVVWFLDAATFFNEIKVTDAYRPPGYALWRMGAEDPARLELSAPALRRGQGRRPGGDRAQRRRRFRRHRRNPARRRLAQRPAGARWRSIRTPA